MQMRSKKHRALRAASLPAGLRSTLLHMSRPLEGSNGEAHKSEGVTGEATSSAHPLSPGNARIVESYSKVHSPIFHAQADESFRIIAYALVGKGSASPQHGWSLSGDGSSTRGGEYISHRKREVIFRVIFFTPPSSTRSDKPGAEW